MTKRRSKRKKQRASGAEIEERRRQRLEERRKEREAAAKAQRRAALRQRLVRGIFIAALLVGVVWFLFFRNLLPGEIGGYEVQSFREQRGHSSGTVNYPMTPPVTGRHSPSAAACGIHDERIQNELFVHSLEHGAVGILYDPQQVEVDRIRAIEALVGEYDERTISAPFPGMETPITATSWGRMMRVDEYDEDALREYIDSFIGRGPEDVPCENDADQPFEPQLEEPENGEAGGQENGQGNRQGGGGGQNRDDQGGG